MMYALSRGKNPPLKVISDTRNNNNSNSTNAIKMQVPTKIVLGNDGGKENQGILKSNTNPADRFLMNVPDKIVLNGGQCQGSWDVPTEFKSEKHFDTDNIICRMQTLPRKLILYHEYATRLSEAAPHRCGGESALMKNNNKSLSSSRMALNCEKVDPVVDEDSLDFKSICGGTGMTFNRTYNLSIGTPAFSGNPELFVGSVPIAHPNWTNEISRIVAGECYESPEEVTHNWRLSGYIDKIKMRVPKRIKAIDDQNSAGTCTPPRKLDFETGMDADTSRIQTQSMNGATPRTVLESTSNDTSYTGLHCAVVDPAGANNSKAIIRSNGGEAAFGSTGCDGRRTENEILRREMMYFNEQLRQMGYQLLMVQGEAKTRDKYLIGLSVLYMAYKAVSWIFSAVRSNTQVALANSAPIYEAVSKKIMK